ncbi:MAG: DUF2202 domain-containing protein [Deltaproteobacteria bacterium]|nr:DUF2202 domain-containing protein [Deltaproteobacteria bacterium]
MRRSMGLVGALVAVLGVAGCGAGEGAAGRGGDGLRAGSGGALDTSERDGLLFLREEEKLARDVYRALGAKDAVFSNIQESEQRHMDSVLNLLERYDVPDPAAARADGDFANATLKALYGQLVAKGSTSTLTALEVGVEIEELDVHDIRELQKTTGHTDLSNVHDNLTRGSRNHLRTFYGRLVALGGTYTPRHLDAATFDAIVQSPMETGPAF